MNSRERMLAAIRRDKPDYVPLSFMIFAALRAERDGWSGRLDAQLDLGLDAVADITGLAPSGSAGHSDAPGVPVSLPADVTVRQGKETPAGSRYPILHKEYETPHGTLTVAVNQTDDWKDGDNVPLIDDYLVPRCTKYLVTCEDDLPALRYVLSGPTQDEIESCRQNWQKGKEFAKQKGLLLAGGWGVGADALGWLCGLDNAVMFAMDAPEFLSAVLDVVSEWNRRRMGLMLDAGLDLFIRRGWYEGTSFWSPALYRRFLLPPLKEEARLAHEAGAAFGYIMSVGSVQFADMLLESGIDVLIGIDPVQDHGMDMAALKAKLGDKIALWGGVNGFVTVERGTDDGIRAAVRTAIETLGPEGFILSPVDNIRETSDEVWQKTLTLIDEWKKARQ